MSYSGKYLIVNISGINYLIRYCGDLDVSSFRRQLLTNREHYDTDEQLIDRKLCSMDIYHEVLPVDTVIL